MRFSVTLDRDEVCYTPLILCAIDNKELLFSRTYQISAPFDNVAGLDEGAPVRAGGVTSAR